MYIKGTWTKPEKGRIKGGRQGWLGGGGGGKVEATILQKILKKFK